MIKDAIVDGNHSFLLLHVRSSSGALFSGRQRNSKIIVATTLSIAIDEVIFSPYPSVEMKPLMQENVNLQET